MSPLTMFHATLDTKLHFRGRKVRIVALNQLALLLPDLVRIDEPTLRAVPRVKVAKHVLHGAARGWTASFLKSFCHGPMLAPSPCSRIIVLRTTATRSKIWPSKK